MRTYRKIKTDFKREQYLYADVDKKSLSNFIKIRVSNCNLNIEKGRYLKLSVEQRICQLCHTDVEDEFHLLMNYSKIDNSVSSPQLGYHCLFVNIPLYVIVFGYRLFIDLFKFFIFFSVH